MRMKKKAPLLIAAVILAGLICSCPALAADELTLERAIAINDTQIVLEFSRPVAVNLNGNNRGPFMAIRLVDSENSLQWTGGAANIGIPLQADGYWEFVDEECDRMLWTIGGVNSLNTVSISSILNYEGELSAFSAYSVTFCIEEVPFNESGFQNDGKLDNITTLDAETKMTANTVRPGWWEGTYLPIEVDYDYQLLGEESVESSETSSSFVSSSAIMSVAPLPESGAEQSGGAGNDNGGAGLLWYIIGGAGLAVIGIAALVVALALYVKNKKK